MKTTFFSLREWLEIVDQAGRLKHVAKKVELRFELAAVSKKRSAATAIVFDDPQGIKYPVVVGSAGSREALAQALGVPVSELASCFSQAQAHPQPCVTVDKQYAPVKEIINEDVDLADLPIPTFHARDAGPFITAGVVVAKNPQTGETNVSIHRMQVHDRNHLGIYLLPRHLLHFQRIAEEQGQPLPIAIVIGLDPIILLASQAIAPLGANEFEIASALYGRPLELVQCEKSDILVPAWAEMVLEGVILPQKRMPEGPFGEYPRYYADRADRHYVELSCMTMRQNALYQAIVPASNEHILLGAVAREGGILRLVQHAVPSAKAVHLTPSGGGRYHLVIQIDKRNRGEAKNAMMAAFASSQEVKHIVVVDTDIDIFNSDEVLHAVATRCQAGRDVMIIEGASCNKMDPSSDDGYGDKMGIDATIPFGAPEGKFEKITIPGEDIIDVDSYFDS